jgi:hypothetical protein
MCDVAGPGDEKQVKDREPTLLTQRRQEWKKYREVAEGCALEHEHAFRERPARQPQGGQPLNDASGRGPSRAILAFGAMHSEQGSSVSD